MGECTLADHRTRAITALTALAEGGLSQAAVPAGSEEDEED